MFCVCAHTMVHLSHLLSYSRREFIDQDGSVQQEYGRQHPCMPETPRRQDQALADSRCELATQAIDVQQQEQTGSNYACKPPGNKKKCRLPETLTGLSAACMLLTEHRIDWFQGRGMRRAAMQKKSDRAALQQGTCSTAPSSP